MLNKNYPDNYFQNRQFNDPLRLKSFDQEAIFISKFTSFNKNVCDVGCSTGEFLEHINWNGKRYGMEVNENAINIAKSNGVSFSRNILTEKNFFDVVIFRGTIQHIDQPFFYIEQAYKSLKKDGKIFFLATPNINSICYKLFTDLPMLDSSLNFYLPSDKNLSSILHNYGFANINIEYPYINSPYTNLIYDHLRFLLKLFLLQKKSNFPFWRNMMNIVATKL